MKNFKFMCTSDMNNESGTAFAMIFFKESGKYLDTHYFTIDTPEQPFSLESREEINNAVIDFVKNYNSYRNTTTVIVSGSNSCVIPRLMKAEERI